MKMRHLLLATAAALVLSGASATAASDLTPSERQAVMETLDLDFVRLCGGDAIVSLEQVSLVEGGERVVVAKVGAREHAVACLGRAGSVVAVLARDTGGFTQLLEVGSSRLTLGDAGPEGRRDLHFADAAPCMSHWRWSGTSYAPEPCVPERSDKERGLWASLTEAVAPASAEAVPEVPVAATGAVAQQSPAAYDGTVRYVDGIPLPPRRPAGL